MRRSMLFLKRLSDRFQEEVQKAADAGVTREIAERDPDVHEVLRARTVPLAQPGQGGHGPG